MYIRKQNHFVVCSRYQIQHCLPLVCLLCLNQYSNKRKAGILYLYCKNVTANESSKLAHLSQKSLCDPWCCLVGFFLCCNFLFFADLTPNDSLIWQSLSLETFCFCSPHILLVSNCWQPGLGFLTSLTHWLFQPFLPLFHNVFLPLLWRLLVQRSAVLEAEFFELFLLVT